jgi:hypothetical protein
MLRSVLLASALLGGCVIGDVSDLDEGGSADLRGDELAGDPAADGLRWSGASSDCVSLRNGVVTSGGSLSVLFDKANEWDDCRFSINVRVPAGVRLTSVLQFVRGHSEGEGNLSYTARINGNSITAKTFNAEYGVDTSARLTTLGNSLCSRGGGDISISFALSKQTANAYLDSIDWEIQAEPCP